MQRILILPNPEKQTAIELTGGIIPVLQRQGFDVILEKTVAEKVGYPLYGKGEQTIWDGIDLVLVLGGDGSMLNAARRIYPRQIPLLGVNLGHLGFLTRIESQKIAAAFEAIHNGEFVFEDRAMLQAEIKRGETNLSRLIALNDLVVVSASRARMVRLETWVDGEFFTLYPADGLIVATATGSTAYSLSAGGPILDPRLEAISVTPICAHSLYARPVIFYKDAHLRVVLQGANPDITVTADGQFTINLQPGDEINFSRAEYTTRLIRFKDQGLFEVLKSRLKEGRI
ncbi:MAG: NAD(+)/NADH kinase [Bacillota bacterium]